MANTTFTDNSTLIVAAFMNDVNDTVYEVLGNGTTAPANAAAVRTNIGLGTMATQNASAVAITGGTVAATTIPVSAMGTGIATTTPYSPVFSGTTATGPFQASLGPGTAGQVLTSAGAGALPVWGAGAAAATDTTAGIVELATTAEIQTGTDTGRVPSVSTLRSGLIVLGTEVATTSGTIFDFSIPSWAKSITVHFDQVSTNGTSPFLIQLGDAGGIETTGYFGATGDLVGAAVSGVSSGFALSTAQSSGSVSNGHVDIKLMNAATFKWTANGIIARSDSAQIYFTAGVKALSAALTTVRVTTTTGQTFDAGAVNVSYQ